MSRRLRIALLIESSRSYGRQLLKGIAAYAREHASWTFFHQEQVFGDLAPPRLKQWKPDGIIARLAGTRVTRQIRRMNLPTVDLYPEGKHDGIPGVAPDPELLARMAIDHFLERGFRNFAYCGLAGVRFSEQRAACFLNQLAARGLRASMFSYPGLPRDSALADVESHAMQYADPLAAWLRGLPKPLALMTCNDIRGQQVLSICGEAGIAVPDQVAVLGIDNDDVHCELCDPPLSSIDPNVERIGFQAAALLDQMLQGKKPLSASHPLKKGTGSELTRVNTEGNGCCEVPVPLFHMPPLGVVVRRSTDVLAIDDPDAAEAIRFAREHACGGIAIGDVAAHASVSRSTLERWFEKHLGRSPAAEIMRVQVQRVQELLRTTNMTLEEIGQAAGFAHAESMQRIFKRMVGQTAGQYRRRDKDDQ